MARKTMGRAWLTAMALLAAGCAVNVPTSGVAPPGKGGVAPNAAGSGIGSGAGVDVVAENAKAGSADWRIAESAVGAQDAIEGYADHTSVSPGESVRIFVSTTSPDFTATAYRIGYYGGADGRAVWQSAVTPGAVQPAPAIDGATNTVECGWQSSLTADTTGWPPGEYLIKLMASNGNGQRYVSLVVRSSSTAGRLVIVAGVTTWQAYNAWGGYSLYHGLNGYADRARAVSFDRPYLDPDESAGDGLFVPFDQALVSFAEQHGLPVAYASDLELESSPALFSSAAGIVSDGHDEYYSARMRQTLLTVRDAGTNLAFFGANGLFRHIRFAATSLGPDRLIICYKDAASDPLYALDPSQTTQNWRDAPDPRPENALTGSFYQCNPVDAAYVVYDPGNWIFAGTGVVQGSSFPGLVGPEYDRVVDIATTPHPIEVLSHSPLTCEGHSSFQESAYYTAPSGAGVFDAGTMRWECALGSQCAMHVTAAGRAFVRQATLNLLQAFALGPVGKAHPATDNTTADGVPNTAGLGID